MGLTPRRRKKQLQSSHAGPLQELADIETFASKLTDVATRIRELQAVTKQTLESDVLPLHWRSDWDDMRCSCETTIDSLNNAAVELRLYCRHLETIQEQMRSFNR